MSQCLAPVTRLKGESWKNKEHILSAFWEPAIMTNKNGKHGYKHLQDILETSLAQNAKGRFHDVKI